MWQSATYRHKFLHTVMLRMKKFHWMHRSIPHTIFPRHWEVTQLAILHGLPENDISQFNVQWTKVRATIHMFEDVDLQSYNHQDWITIAAFDKCCASLIPQSPICARLASLAAQEILVKGTWRDRKSETPEVPPALPPRSPPLEPAEVQHKETPKVVAAETTTTVITVTDGPADPAPLERWVVPECKVLEHVHLIRSIGHERGNYIGQIGPKQYKFGLTDKDFVARSGQHSKDFDQFVLVWAQHCSNSTRAEALFKNDPRIRCRLIRKTTLKNRHREIILIDELCNESAIKTIYGEYVKLVNDEERSKLLGGGGTENTESAPAVQQEHRPQQPSNEYMELERERLAFEKDKFEKEYALRLREIELQASRTKEQERAEDEKKKTAALPPQPTYLPSDLDAALILSRLRDYCQKRNAFDDPKRKKLKKGKLTGSIMMVSPITEHIISCYQTPTEACKMLRHLKLQPKGVEHALQTGALYSGYYWKRS